MTQSQNRPDSPRRQNGKGRIDSYWDLDKLGQEPGDLKANLAPVFAYLDRKFADWGYTVSRDDYSFRLDEENDRLTLWVEQGDLLDTSPYQLEMEYSFLMEGGFLTAEGNPFLKSFGPVFEQWIPLIKETRKKSGGYR
jgi:hypothetical protein